MDLNDVFKCTEYVKLHMGIKKYYLALFDAINFNHKLYEIVFILIALEIKLQIYSLFDYIVI